MDDLLDTLSVNYKLKIVFERDSLHQFDVVDHFFNEPLNKVFDLVCSKFNLHYWIDYKGTIYILQKVDDMARLSSLEKTLKPITVQKPDSLPSTFSSQHRAEPMANAKQLNNVVQPALTKGTEKPLTQKLNQLPVNKPINLLVTINGKIIDQSSGMPLPSATIKIRNTDIIATTNTDGDFTVFKVPADTCTVEISYSGYQSDQFKLTTEKLSNPIVVELLPAFNTLNEVSIIGQKRGVMNTDVKKVGVLQLTPANLDKLPSLGEKDILRAFQLMPVCIDNSPVFPETTA